MPLNDVVGTTDELIANVGYVNAMTFDNATCGTRQSFQALGDVDGSRFVQAPAPCSFVSKVRRLLEAQPREHLVHAFPRERTDRRAEPAFLHDRDLRHHEHALPR